MANSDRPVIEVRGLAKRFNEVEAVAGIDFDVRAGEVFGFLGPNGAGKTTTINMLTGLARPDAGALRVGGIDCTGDPKAAQHLMGVVPDESNLYPELTGRENLCFCGALYGMRRHEREARADELLGRFGLAEVSGRRFAGYSRGMKRKLTIAAGIIHSPEILFLDEPTTGIDVASARQIRQLIADMNAGGMTVFLTTHYIEEAERLCRRIAFIVKGRIVRIDAMQTLLRLAQDRHEVEFSIDGDGANVEAAVKEAFPDLETHIQGDGRLRVASKVPVRVGPLVRFLEDRSLEVSEARVIRPSLEDVFVRVTGLDAAAMKREKEKPGGSA